MASNGKKFAIGTLLAGVAGYLAGILTAPKSGKETRKDIEDKVVKARREAEKQLKYLLAELESVIKKAKSTSSDLSKKLGKEGEKALKNANAAKERVRQLITSIHEGDSDDNDLDQAIKDATAAVNHLKKYLKQVKADSK